MFLSPKLTRRKARARDGDNRPRRKCIGSNQPVLTPCPHPNSMNIGLSPPTSYVDPFKEIPGVLWSTLFNSLILLLLKFPPAWTMQKLNWTQAVPWDTHHVQNTRALEKCTCTGRLVVSSQSPIPTKVDAARAYYGVFSPNLRAVTNVHTTV